MAAKALLIIDMQRGDFPPVKERYQPEVTIEKIRQLAVLFRNNEYPVIYIQHDGTAEGAFVPGTPEWEILPAISPLPTDLVISKTANDAFYESDLLATLRKHEIEELFITGSATDYCVDATVKGALTKDLYITVVSDAHTSVDRPHVSAAQLIKHYNWVWNNMTPTQGKCSIKTSAEIIDMLT